MHILNDQKLLRMIRYAPVLIIGTLTVIISLSLISSNREKAKQSIAELRTEVLERQKASIKQRVMHIAQETRYQKALAETVLKEQAKSRVEEAHEIAMSIYNNHREESKSVVTQLINEALRPIRFFDGRGYFFIFTMEGINVMHGLRPQIEGKSAWDAQDTRGKFILREHIELIKEHGESFYQWWYPKPGQPADVEFEKIGFGKEFLPYDWFIGTGEYVKDIEDDIKGNVLHWINSYRFDENSYIFVVDDKGTLLAHKDQNLIGQSIVGLKNSQGDSVWEKFNNISPDGGFVEYELLFSNEDSKLSYLEKIADWEWTIGTGYNLAEFDAYLGEKEAALKEQNRQELIRISLISALLTLLFMAISLLLSVQVSARFSRFQSKINNHFDELEQTRDQMQYMALHDVLTGLPNRILLIDNIEVALRKASHEGKKIAIAFVDLDDFKRINDLHGHSAGDSLLKKVGERFQNLLEGDDSVARFGGDEFVFCFPALDSVKEAERKVQLVKNVFTQSFEVSQRSLLTNCSIGVSMYPSDGMDVETLIRNADIVLYKSKAQNKGSVMFYDDSINEQVQQAFRLEEQLREAINNDEISVVYQPQIDIKTLKMVGVEALARWHNEKLGHVRPDVFIAAAEDTGLIHDIGLYVFERSCEDLAELSQTQYGENFGLSVNISPKQLIEITFINDLLAITHRHGVDVGRITLEITENVLINDLGKVTPTLVQLRELGFGISLDDFGTGYSSLSYLNNLPITEIKIDRCFIDRMLVNSQSMSLVKAIIAIGEASNLIVVAEGVENSPQFEQLKYYGCCLAQGYLFDKPQEFEVLMSRMKENQYSF